MPIDPTNTLARPTPVQTQSTEETQQKMGREAFMKLLVTQLQNQDPLEPMDNREMITQLSQLTGVEQLASIEQRMQALEVATAGLGNTQVAGLVGKTLTANAGNMRLGELGSADADFTLEGQAASVEVRVIGADGDVVRTIPMGERFPGTHKVEWDGKDDAGERAGPGRYTIEVVARDADGHPVEASTRVTGRADSVTYENGYPELVVGDARIMLGDVVSIAE